MMRVALLLTAVWGFWVMPVLCESGMWTECCAQTCPESQDDDCGERSCPEPAPDCDCTSCVELCNARVTKPTAGVEIPAVAANPLAILSLPGDERTGDPLASSARSRMRCCCTHLPYPPSDRPLLL